MAAKILMNCSRCGEVIIREQDAYREPGNNKDVCHKCAVSEARGGVKPAIIPGAGWCLGQALLTGGVVIGWLVGSYYLFYACIWLWFAARGWQPYP